MCTCDGFARTGCSEASYNNRLARFRIGPISIWLPNTRARKRALRYHDLHHVLTEPHVHRYSRPLYELAGQRQPLPRPTTAEELRGLRPPAYERRFSNAQAAVGLRQLRRLEENLAHRRSVSAAYRERLAGSAVRVPDWPTQAEPAFVRYPIWVEDRAAAERKVRPHAVLGTWFTSVLEEASTPSVGRYEAGSCERAEAAARHLVNLPTHLRVTPDDVEAITAALATA